MVHLNATALPNGTIMDTTASHVGQIFFDQDLIYEVEALYPYSQNTQDLWTNSDDDILAQEAESSDPLVEYVYLGKEHDVNAGILAWLSFGVDMNYVRNVSAASYYYKEGGVANPSAGEGISLPSAS